MGGPSDRVPDGSLHIVAKGKKKDGDRRRQTRALSVRFDPLALLWHFFEGSGVLGFPDCVLRDSWVVGLMEGRPWTRPGSLILIGGLHLSSVLSGTRHGHACARFMSRG